MSIVVFSLCKGFPQYTEFSSKELLEALKLTEYLRAEGYTHVCISSELKDSVGKPGVAEASPDYDWKKRRV